MNLIVGHAAAALVRRSFFLFSKRFRILEIPMLTTSKCIAWAAVGLLSAGVAFDVRAGSFVTYDVPGAIQTMPMATAARESFWILHR